MEGSFLLSSCCYVAKSSHLLGPSEIRDTCGFSLSAAQMTPNRTLLLMKNCGLVRILSLAKDSGAELKREAREESGSRERDLQLVQSPKPALSVSPFHKVIWRRDSKYRKMRAVKKECVEREEATEEQEEGNRHNDGLPRPVGLPVACCQASLSCPDRIIIGCISQ